MKDRSNTPFAQLMEEALKTELVHGWEQVGDVILLHLNTMTVYLDEDGARSYVRGLLRGYEVAQLLDEE